jgi:hypothetical protein
MSCSQQNKKVTIKNDSGYTIYNINIVDKDNLRNNSSPSFSSDKKIKLGQIKRYVAQVTYLQNRDYVTIAVLKNISNVIIDFSVFEGDEQINLRLEKDITSNYNIIIDDLTLVQIIPYYHKY